MMVRNVMIYYFVLMTAHQIWVHKTLGFVCCFKERRVSEMKLLKCMF